MDIAFQRRIEAAIRDLPVLKAAVEALTLRLAELEGKFDPKRPKLTLPKGPG